MSAFILRQLVNTVVPGDQAELSSQPLTSFQSSDVNPKQVLKLADGNWVGYDLSLATLATHTVQLPNEYASTSRLFWIVRSDATVKVTVSSPDHTTSNYLLKPLTGAEGLASHCGTVTSIVLTNPTAAAAQVEFFAFTLPDINDPDSWRTGTISLPYQPADQ